MSERRVKATRTAIVNALRRFWFLGCFVLVSGSSVLAQQSPLELGSRRELFLDQYLIDKLDHARLQLHEPRDEGTVLRFDQPWEGIHCGYCTMIRDEIQNTSGHPIPGFAAADCVEVIGNEIDRTVSWKSGSELGSVAGKAVRVRFVMKDPDLYAMRFASEGRQE